ncbi:hypothetical protein MLD38_029574 [Melastoma candidum]|uniref:Uncharacterized protein n=1 Tax=Melastoma candidum TaxID=119954 RepID=A0ACB9N5T9_9MYRT|nr:hypothetical protein MLD38_029574 [Melastoma candidum]
MGWLSIKLLFTLVVLAASCIASFAIDTAHIYIYNDIEYGPTLTVHCRSKDDDLGQRDIPPKFSWDFSFGLDMLTRETEIDCSFKFNDEAHLFPIYLQPRDEFDCMDCYWKITKAGPCRTDEDHNVAKPCDRWVGGVLR